MKKFILNLMMVAYCNATAFAQQKVMLSGVSNSFVSEIVSAMT